MGAERKSVVLTDEDKRVTAFHEAGHALVALLQKGTDPVHKITIIPRGRSLGMMQQLPDRDRYSHQRDHLLKRIAVIMGGRAAEKIVFDMVSTGPGQDIKQATQIARKMVCEWGMSDTIGPLYFADDHEAPFLGGGSGAPNRPYSEELARDIDREVRRIVTEGYEKAVEILHRDRELLDLMGEALLQYETLDAAEIQHILKERDLTWIEQERVRKEEARAEREEKAPKTGFASKLKDKSAEPPPVSPDLAPTSS